MLLNARFVRPCLYTADGAALMGSLIQIPHFIVSESPKEQNVTEFLTMVYNYRVPVVVMLGGYVSLVFRLATIAFNSVFK